MRRSNEEPQIRDREGGSEGKCVPPLIGINTCLQQDINWHPVSQPLHFSLLLLLSSVSSASVQLSVL